MWIMPNFADFKSQERRNPLHISKFLMMHRPAKPRFPSSNLGGTSRVKAPKSLCIKAFGAFLFLTCTFAAVKQNPKLAPKLPNFCRIYHFLSLCTGLYRTKVFERILILIVFYSFYNFICICQVLVVAFLLEVCRSFGM